MDPIVSALMGNPQTFVNNYAFPVVMTFETFLEKYARHYFVLFCVFNAVENGMCSMCHTLCPDDMTRFSKLCKMVGDEASMVSAVLMHTHDGSGPDPSSFRIGSGRVFLRASKVHNLLWGRHTTNSLFFVFPDIAYVADGGSRSGTHAADSSIVTLVGGRHADR